jgi:hypothetical protein
MRPRRGNVLLYYAGDGMDHHARRSSNFCLNVYFYGGKHFKPFGHRNDFETVYTIPRAVWKRKMVYESVYHGWLPRKQEVVRFADIATSVRVTNLVSGNSQVYLNFGEHSNGL